MTTTALSLLTNTLATKRLTRLITEDQITSLPRNAIMDRFPHSRYLLTCNWCSSIWAAAIVTSPLTPTPIKNILALSEAAMLVYKLDDVL